MEGGSRRGKSLLGHAGERREIEEKLRTQLLDLRPTMERKYPRTEKRGDAARSTTGSWSEAKVGQSI